MSGAFLSPSSPSAREREAERAEALYHEYVAQKCYRWATRLLIVGMVLIALPLPLLVPWHWYIVGGLALVMTILAVQMMRHGRVLNGLICLVCAFGVLPGWLFLAGDVVAAGYDLYRIVADQWIEKFK